MCSRRFASCESISTCFVRVDSELWLYIKALACRRRCSLGILFVLCNNTLPLFDCTTWLVMGRTIEALQFHPSRSNLITVSDTVWTPIRNIHAATTQRNKPAAVPLYLSYWESSRLMLLMTTGHGIDSFSLLLSIRLSPAPSLLMGTYNLSGLRVF